MRLRRAALRIALLLCVCSTSFATRLAATTQEAQGETPRQATPTIKTTTSLVLVDVLVEDKKSGEPIKELEKEDFLLRDDGKPVDIRSFNRGKDQNLRPLQLWFVMVCNEERRYQVGGRRRTQIESTEILGASFLAGKTAELLRAGIEHLNKDETVGVAHWCDNGESEIDQAPTTDRDRVLQAMDEIASRKKVVIDEMTNEDSREHVQRLIEEVAQTAFPVPMTVTVFVGEKKTALSTGKPEDASGEMEFWSMDSGEGESRGSGAADSSTYKVQNNEYGKRLGTIIDMLHSRYEIGFSPGRAGKKTHRVEVTMNKAAKERYASALVRYRDIYRNNAQEETAEAKKQAAKLKQLDSRMQMAVKSQTNQDGLAFEVREMRGAEAGTERLALRIAAQGLTWTMLPNGDRRSVVTAVVACYSAKGQPIGLTVKELEIVEASDRLQALKDKPVHVLVTANVAKGVARIRVVVRDVATGHIGTQDVQPVAMRRSVEVVPKAVKFLQQTGSIRPGTAAIRVQSSLVLVDVISKDRKNGLPVRELKKEDFRVYDDDAEVAISSFDAGAGDARPVIVWLVAICNERGKIGGSSEYVGNESRFGPALAHLAASDSVGVAHWCDNGEAQLDLQPTRDPEKVIGALREVIQPIGFQAGTRETDTVGEATFRKMIRLIIQDAHRRNPQPLPVIVFLDGDHTGQPRQELDEVIDDLLETSGIVFGIKDSTAPKVGRLFFEVAEIEHYMAEKTGGEYFSTTSKGYATALEAILLQLHFRYVLGFVPSAIDGRRHQLRVELTKGAEKKFRGARLKFRPEYIPLQEVPEWAQ